MHAKLAAILSFFLVVAMSGCATSSAKMNGVHLGMGKSEVVDLLGQPANTNAQANIEYLTYYLSNDSTVHDQPYMVRLVDGKVESFGRFFQLFDEYNRPVNSGTKPPVSMGAIMPYSINTSIITQLQQLQALKDQGVLTEDEFQNVKKRLLAERN